ncbi:uncharacterized protein HD556DRAFT_443167 [Suillus plorans]|uniref:Uncharacterized protein n=1 Tax=Suillus plorans TaxID=116603 RepID=A0A9P7AQ91_9AGAM|nr:uncharacterized protein HD556DRAFT_443167 [Suillus plorans]KAG1794181.1 hypothetical protein HD556DRAFT_443167 [Suillus plorans]
MSILQVLRCAHCSTSHGLQRFLPVVTGTGTSIHPFDFKQVALTPCNFNHFTTHYAKTSFHDVITRPQNIQVAAWYLIPKSASSVIPFHLTICIVTIIILVLRVDIYLKEKESDPLAARHSRCRKVSHRIYHGRKMKSLKVTEQTHIETRLAGTFLFSHKHIKRHTTGHFFAMLTYQPVNCFPTVRDLRHVDRAVLEDPALLEPDKSVRDQMDGRPVFLIIQEASR